MSKRLVLCAVLVGLVLGTGCTSSRQASAPTPDSPTQDDFKPYSSVITKVAETDEGLFTVHRVDEKLYYEIPDSLLDEEMLLVSRIARTATNVGYGGQKAHTQGVRWQRRGDEVLLRVVAHENVADENDPIYQAVRNANFEPILMAFAIEALGPDKKSVVINVTKLFSEDVPALGLQQGRRHKYKVSRLDTDRTFISSAKSFPRNVEVRNLLTYAARKPPANTSTNTLSLEMNHSMVRLPEEPMTPRPCDERVGYFNVEMTNYSLDAQKAEEACYITRRRLEPRDTAAFRRGELVEPKTPIVYYIDPATPEKWRPYLKQGVEDWNEAFRAAGFKNAVLAKDPPSVEEDSAFSPEDVRYSVIRYYPSETQNAYGPHVHDPRTGEILESDIGWYHNVMNLLRNWYFVQTAAANLEARGVQFEDKVMGKLIRFVAAHEVGHTLGLAHNWGASASYPVDSLRSPTFTATHGTAPSIMDYARFNYVAQPGDSVASFLPKIGAYDTFAIRWGYRPLPDAHTPQAQEPALDRWSREHADDDRYFYGQQTGGQIDPRSQREDLGANAVKASTYGLANLKRVTERLVDWTYESGAFYDELNELYGEVIDQWTRYVQHVTRTVGGVYETPKTFDQEGVVYEVVPPEKQRAAMTFLQENVFATPRWLLNDEVLRRIERAGALERVRGTQVQALKLLFAPDRLERLIEAETMTEEASYGPAEMLKALRVGLWSELEQAEPIGPYRRNVQRSYLKQLGELMRSDAARRSDIQPYVRGELVALRDNITQALDRTGPRRLSDHPTRLHLQDVLARIEAILNPDGHRASPNQDRDSPANDAREPWRF